MRMRMQLRNKPDTMDMDYSETEPVFEPSCPIRRAGIGGVSPTLRELLLTAIDVVDESSFFMPLITAMDAILSHLCML